MIQDCLGKVLATVGAIEQAGLGRPVFAVNGRPGRRFSPATPHQELIDGLRISDVVSFKVPALTEPHELVTWYQTVIQDSPHCATNPPVTVTFTCAGINVATVNTDGRERDLQIVAPLAPLMGAIGIRVQGITLWLRRIPVVPRPETAEKEKVDQL